MINPPMVTQELGKAPAVFSADGHGVFQDLDGLVLVPYLCQDMNRVWRIKICFDIGVAVINEFARYCESLKVAAGYPQYVKELQCRA